MFLLFKFKSLPDQSFKKQSMTSGVETGKSARQRVGCLLGAVRWAGKTMHWIRWVKPYFLVFGVAPCSSKFISTKII